MHPIKTKAQIHAGISRSKRFIERCWLLVLLLLLAGLAAIIFSTLNFLLP